MADGNAIEQIILGESEAIRGLRAEIEAIAATPFRSVLVEGETGTGKDLVPRALLAHCPRAKGRLEVFNCPAVPADHLESELFGTTRGAYPGAIDRPGAAERAHEGLLFLDEISGMPLAHQAKVLRLLESGEARRLGASRSYRVDLCIVAATNECLSQAVARGAFREDLFYRLVQDAVLVVPPLRERREDVALLAELFLAELPEAPRLEPSAVERLEREAWPGNVRQLRAVVRSAARQACGPTLGRDAIERALARLERPATLAVPPASELAAEPSFHAATSELRRRMLADALAAANGNQTLAGVLLGLHATREGAPAVLDLRARKLAHRKFHYWWERLGEGAAAQ